MAIRKEQPGAAKAAAVAGTAIGQAKRAEEDRARVEREQARADQEAAQRQARQTAMAWDLQKMQLRSQQEFEQELRTTQYGLDRFNRAKEWDIEKMELRSRMDFQQEEEERIRETGRIDADIRAVKKLKDTEFTGREFEYESMLFDLEQQKLGIKNPRRLPDPQVAERAESRETRAEDTAQRAQEVHEARLDKGPSMVDKRWAIKFLADNPKPWFFDDEETAEGRKIAREILGSDASTVEDATRTMNEVSVPPADIKYQQNRRTGQKRVSYDGGKTWQNL